MPMSSDAGRGMKVKALGPALLGLLLLLGGLSRAVPAEEALTKGKILATYEVDLG